jgi:hypothetical protein
MRAGLGRNEWVLLISFPDNVGGNLAALALAQVRGEIPQYVVAQSVG